MIIHFEMLGETVLARDLLAIGQRAVAAQPAWLAIIEAMQEDTGDQFDSEGGAQSGGWKPLAASTVLYKSIRKLRPEILRATDRMRNSLIGETSDTVKQVLPFEFSWGTDVEYTAFHQTGTSKMPQRRVIDFTEAQRTKYVKILQRYIIEGGI